MRKFPSVLAGVLALIFTSLASAQVPGLGYNPEGVFQHGDIDSVNIENDNATIGIPLLSYPQRGSFKTLNVNLTGNTNIWTPTYTPDGGALPTGYYTPSYSWFGPRVDIGQLVELGGADMPYIDTDGNQHDSQTSWVQDSDGAMHTLLVDANSVAYPNTQNDAIYRTVDGSGYLYDYHDGLYLRDSSGRSMMNTTSYTKTDLDGNSITQSGGVITDTIGRVISPISPGITPISSRCSTTIQDGTGAGDTQPLTSSYDWGVPGINGTTVHYTICYATIGIRTNMWQNGGNPFIEEYCDVDGDCGGAIRWYEWALQMPVIQSVVLPNGTYWGFRYDSLPGNDFSGGGLISGLPNCTNTLAVGPSTNCAWGLITKVIEPTGGSISYTYTLAGVLNFNAEPEVAVAPQVTSRTVNDGAGTTGTWQYGLPGVSVRDPNGNDMVLTATGSGPGGEIAPWYPTYTKSQIWYNGYASGGSILKEIDSSYTMVWGPTPTGYPGYPSVVADIANSSTTKLNGVTVGTTFPGYGLSFNATAIQCTWNPSYGTWTCDNGDGSTLFSLGIPDITITEDASSTILRRTFRPEMALINSDYWSDNILSYPDYVEDGDGTTNSQTDFTYDTTFATSGTPFASKGHIATSTVEDIGDSGANATTTMTWTSYGMLASSTDPGGHETSYTYDSTYNLYPIQITYPSTNTTIAEGLGIPTSNHVEYFQYDANTGSITKSVNQNGSGISDTTHATTYSYDSFGALTNVASPDGGNVAYNYGSYALPVTITTTVTASPDPNRVNIVQLDGLGRAVRSFVQANSGGTLWDQTDTCYDSLGRVDFTTYTYQGSGTGGAARVCPGGTTLAGDTTSYDALGRAARVTHSTDSSYVESDYSVLDTKITSEGHPNASGTTIYPQRIAETDFLGRTTKVCEVSSNSLGVYPYAQSPGSCGLTGYSATGYLTTYAYDGLGNLTTVHQDGITDRTFTYDSMSRLLSASNPESGTITYSYNTDSLVTQRVAPEANQLSGSTATTTTNYYYDQMHRLYEETYNDGITPSDAFVYDGTSGYDGNGYIYESYTVSPSGTPGYVNQFTYDDAGRMNYGNVGDSSGSDVLEYTYDAAGNMNQLNDTGLGYEIDMNSDAEGRTIHASMIATPFDVVPVGDIYGTSSVPATYLPGGISQATLAGGNLLCNTYDSRNRLTSTKLASSCSSGTPLYSASGLTYSADSSLSAAIDSILGSAWSYGYDEFNRLQSATQGSGGLTLGWTYDRYGNRLSQSPSGTSSLSVTTSSYTFPASTSSPGNNRNTSFCYDIAGNVLDLTACPSGAHQFVYDAEHRLVSSGSGATTYVYDEYGRRIQKLSGTDATNFNYFYDANGDMYLIWSNDLTTLFANAYVDHKKIASSDANVGNLVASAGDWVGTTRVENSSGGLYGKWASLPFGDALSCASTVCTNTDGSHFTGQINDDPGTGIEYFNARYYYSASGRFLSPDPSGLSAQKPTNPQSWNLYSYALNDPLIIVDPTGLDCVYYDNNGSAIETVDPTNYDQDMDQQSHDCGINGGNWVNGTLAASSYDANTDTWSMASMDANNAYLYSGVAPGGSGSGDGTNWMPDCQGNCLYGSSASIGSLIGQLQNGGTLTGLLQYAVSQPPSAAVSGAQVNINASYGNTTTFNNWCGSGGAGVPGNSNAWACLAHDYNYSVAGFSPSSNFNLTLFLNPTKAAELQRINQTLCDNVSGLGGAEIYGWFHTIGSITAPCH